MILVVFIILLWLTPAAAFCDRQGYFSVPDPTNMRHSFCKLSQLSPS
jgi:hypothetical protein